MDKSEQHSTAGQKRRLQRITVLSRVDGIAVIHGDVAAARRAIDDLEAAYEPGDPNDVDEAIRRLRETAGLDDE